MSVQWRKQVLPAGVISYRGRDIRFTDSYLSGLVSAFKGRAVDCVPFVLFPDGAHTNDPQWFRGEVTGLEVVPDGLDALITVDDETSGVISADPGLGAAPQIIEDYRRADGEEFPAVVRHVLGTRKPMITGLRVWQRLTG